MVNVFANAAISGLFAGIVSIAISAAIEKFGGLIGGVLGSTPTTIIPALIGIYLEFHGDHDRYTQAAFAVPIGTFINSLFLLTWKTVPRYLKISQTKYKLTAMVFITLLVWLCMATGSMFLKTYLVREYNFDVRWYGTIFFGLHFTLGLLSTIFQSSASPKGKNKPSIWMILSRGLITGMAIATSIILSHYVDPAIGGITSTFPAIFMTTMVTVWLTQGESVVLGAAGPLMMGMLSVATFAMASTIFVFKFGLPLGLLCTYLIAICVSLIVASFLKLRQRIAEKQYLRLDNQPSGANLLSSQPSEGLLNVEQDNNQEMTNIHEAGGLEEDEEEEENKKGPSSKDKSTLLKK